MSASRASAKPKGTFYIQLDTREHDLLACFQQLRDAPESIWAHIDLRSAQLPAGDLCLWYSPPPTDPPTPDREILVVERKTVADLASSITDGRYREQSFRLAGLPEHPFRHDIVYLIEGALPPQGNGGGSSSSGTKYKPLAHRGGHAAHACALTPAAAATATTTTTASAPAAASHPGATWTQPPRHVMALHTAVFQLLFHKGFSVLQTTGAMQSAFAICNMVRKLTAQEQAGEDWRPFVARLRDHSGEHAGGAPNEDELAAVSTSAYVSHVAKRARGDNITPANIHEIMLCQIPGISAASAAAILASHRTVAGLVAALQTQPTCLDQLQIETVTRDGTTKRRKISRAVVDNIRRFLMPEA